MSITVADVMRLPSMVGAEVLAGQKGLSNPVESITVLEYGHPSDLLDRLFQGNNFEGNELMISALSNIWDDVDAQCANIRKYASVGSVGLIVYYVGVILPEIDQRLIDCCNELDFVLISMPKGEVGRKYSEVISEVLFEIFREQTQEHFFVSSLLDRISNLQEHQRNMDTLLRMLSEHLRATVILTNRRNTLYNAVYWPRTIEGALESPIKKLLKKAENQEGIEVPVGDGAAYLQKCPALLDDMDDMRLYIMKYGEPLPNDMLWQSSEVVRLFIHIWNKNHGKFVTSELIRAIINDEPLKMNRLSKLFHIKVSELNQIWIFIPKDSSRPRDEKLLRVCADYFSTTATDSPLIGYYEEKLIVCTTAPLNAAQRNALMDGLALQITEMAGCYDIVYCDCLATTAEVRHAYLDSMEYLEAARKIYPNRQILRLTDIMLAKQCQQLVERHEPLDVYLSIISKIKSAGAELLTTVTTYLLDADSNMSLTAKLLFVHLNTVKYRLKLIQDLSGFSPNKAPDSYQIYISVALNRLLENSI